MAKWIWTGNCSECNARIYTEYEDERGIFATGNVQRECGYYRDENNKKQLCSFVISEEKNKEK
jgi:hypothetical protein